MKSKVESKKLIFITFVSIYMLIFVIATMFAFVSKPFGDIFDWLAIELRAIDTSDPGYFLWTPHAGHHLVWARLLTSIDVRLFHGQSWIFLIVTALCLLGSFLLIRSEIQNGIGNKNVWTNIAGIIIPLTLFISINSIDIGIHVNCVYTIVLFFVIATICICERESNLFYNQFLIILLFVCALFGNGIGVALVPVLLFSIFRKPNRSWADVLTIVALLLLSFFIVFNFQTPSINNLVNHSQSFALRMMRYTLYFLDFCGLPWSSSSPRHLPFSGFAYYASQAFGPLVGIVMLGLGLSSIRNRVMQSTPCAKLERIAQNLIVFSITAAAIATLGRVDVLPEVSVPVRYALLVAPLHIGILICLMLRSQTLIKLNSRETLYKYIPILGILLILQQLAGLGVVYKYSSKLGANIEAFAQGSRSPEVMTFMYFNFNEETVEYLNSLISEIKKRELYQ